MNPECKPPPKGGPLRAVATPAELQADIDCGLTGEKVAALDPAASPLGTDEEAGGHPTSPEVLGEERRRARREAAVEGTNPSHAAIDAARRRKVSPALLLAAGALALGAAVAVAVLG